MPDWIICRIASQVREELVLVSVWRNCLQNQHSLNKINQNKDSNISSSTNSYHQRRNGGSCNTEKRTEIRSKLESPKVTAIVTGTTMDWIMKNKSSMRGQKLRVSHQCVLCYTNFDGITARASLNIHRNKVHKDEVHLLVSAIAKTDLQFTCTFCQLVFISTISRDFHIKSVHEVVSVCPECSNPPGSCRCKEVL